MFRSGPVVRCDEAEGTQVETPVLSVRSDAGVAGKAVKADNGWLKVPATISRTGVLTYRFADGSTRKELRLPDEVFKADSLASLQMVPVTLSHPPTSSGLLDAGNTKLHSIGSVGETIQHDESTIQAVLMITDAKAIAAIEAGTKQISAGYTTCLEFTPGTYQGERYDAIQRDIRYNHVAVVKSGRAGPGARLHLDAATEVAERVMEKITINGVDFEVSKECAQAYKVTCDAAKTELSKQSARGDSLEATLATERKARTDAEDPEKIKKAVKARLDLERSASAVLKGVKLDALSDAEIMTQVVTKVYPTMAEKMKTAEAAYVQASFDMAIAAPVQTSEGLTRARQGEDPTTVRADGAKTSEQVRLDFIKVQNEAWKKPIQFKDNK